ncbi:MAG TPA: electron transfer flavoprotein subunit alpha/FixB family protein [Clostridia bacterium]|nr:electron transfer flavoprotein subunit alpha/FixB family protein [Clostridia bacterium]
MKKKIWVFAEQVNCTLDRVTLELLTKAKELAAAISGETEIGAVLLGRNVKNLCGILANYGAETIYLAESEELGLYNHMLYAPLISELIKQEDPEIVLFGATAIGSELGPTVAAQLKTGVAAHCVDMRIDENEHLVAAVPSFGGKILGEILCPDTRPQMASVKPGIFVQGEAEQREPNIIMIDVSKIKADNIPLKAVKLDKKEIEGVPLDSAEVVLCGGYGLGNKANWDKLEKLAALLSGAAACTRPVVDEGWAPGEHVMVGTSGKSIRPKAYIGFGISGATHHVCGMKDSGLVINVNRDEKTAMFEVSDIGIAADLNEILDQLLTKLS